MCVVGVHVEIGPESRLISHVVVEGSTRIDARNVEAMGNDRFVPSLLELLRSSSRQDVASRYKAVGSQPMPL